MVKGLKILHMDHIITEPGMIILAPNETHRHVDFSSHHNRVGIHLCSVPRKHERSADRTVLLCKFWPFQWSSSANLL